MRPPGPPYPPTPAGGLQDLLDTYGYLVLAHPRDAGHGRFLAEFLVKAQSTRRLTVETDVQLTNGRRGVLIVDEDGPWASS